MERTLVLLQVSEGVARTREQARVVMWRAASCSSCSLVKALL